MGALYTFLWKVPVINFSIFLLGVSFGLYWFVLSVILVYVCFYWFILVCIGLYWFILVCPWRPIIDA